MLHHSPYRVKIIFQVILHTGENLTFACEDFGDWFAFGEAFDTEISEALDKCESNPQFESPKTKFSPVRSIFTDNPIQQGKGVSTHDH
jgi:hypothetical protein